MYYFAQSLHVLTAYQKVIQNQLISRRYLKLTIAMHCMVFTMDLVRPVCADNVVLYALDDLEGMLGQLQSCMI